MGRKTHGPYLIAAIELNDFDKVSDILARHFRDRKRVKDFLVTEVPRLAAEYTEIPMLLAASLPDPNILRYFVTKHDANVNHSFESGSPKHRKSTTVLLMGVRRGLYDTVDAILTLNGDVNAADHKGRRPLHHAVRRFVSKFQQSLFSYLNSFCFKSQCSTWPPDVNINSSS